MVASRGLNSAGWVGTVRASVMGPSGVLSSFGEQRLPAGRWKGEGCPGSPGDLGGRVPGPGLPAGVLLNCSLARPALHGLARPISLNLLRTSGGAGQTFVVATPVVI